jgi:hypothetical protein
VSGIDTGDPGDADPGPADPGPADPGQSASTRGAAAPRGRQQRRKKRK